MAQPNTSATGGPLAPVQPFALDPGPTQGGLDTGGLDNPQAELNDADLDAFLQAQVAAITGLPGPLVRPRWQPEPPDEPDISVDWCAVGITDAEADVHDWEAHLGGNGGSSVQYRNEVMELLCTFYGPRAGYYARRLREGLQVAQNREPLLLQGIGLVETGRIVTVPELIKQRWYRRVDLSVWIRRGILHSTAILNLRSAAGTLVTDVPPTSTPINTTPPAGT